MTSANTNMQRKDGNPNRKCQEYKSRIQQLEQDVIEKEDECMFWYRQFEDAKEARPKGSVKTCKHQHSYLEGGKET